MSDLSELTEEHVLLVTEDPGSGWKTLSDTDADEIQQAMVEELTLTVDQLRDEQASLKDTAQRIGLLQERVLKLSEALDAGSHFSVKGRWTRINRSVRRNFNLAKLRREVGLMVFDEVTIPKIDTKEYDRLRAGGVISDEVDAAVVTRTPSKPYITFGKPPAAEESEED
jgi:hypothetical protein